MASLLNSPRLDKEEDAGSMQSSRRLHMEREGAVERLVDGETF